MRSDKKPQKTYHDQMQVWIDSTQGYVIAQMEKGANVDLERVRHQLAAAIAEGVFNGRGDGYVYEMAEIAGVNGKLRIDDKHFRQILDVLTQVANHPKRKNEVMTLSFPDNLLTDESLGVLGNMLRDSTFPVNLILDLSGDNKFTPKGVEGFMRALGQVEKNLNIEIKFPAHTKNIGEDTMRALKDQINLNRQKYQMAFAEKQKKKVTKPKAEGKSASTRLGGLFKKKTKAEKPESKRKYEKVNDQDSVRKHGLGRSSKE